MEETLRPRVQDALTPSRPEVVRAKREILQRLGSGDPHATTELLVTLCDAEGLQAPSDRTLDLPNRESADAVVTRDHPLLTYERLKAAAMEAIAELESQGLIMPASPRWAGGLSLDSLYSLHIGWRLPGSSSGFQVQLPLPRIDVHAYRLPHRLLGRETWWLDADLFLDPLTDLALLSQTRRSLEEALSAYRRGLFLAALSLLGATSEGAWYAIAEGTGPSGKLRQALDSGQTSEVIRLTAERLRAVPRLGSQVDGLVAHAELLRDLRNFGIHPSSNDHHLDRYFTEEEAGTLFLGSWNYFKKLAEVALGWQQTQQGP